jgi:hypothetical protein
MSLQAERFVVSLERSGAGEAVCLVTADTEFTQQVQSALKFSITNRTADGSKTKVSLLQDLCRLSGDLAQFRFGFPAAEVGTYKVIVKFGDAHVSSSPLQFHVRACRRSGGPAGCSSTPAPSTSSSLTSAGRPPSSSTN